LLEEPDFKALPCLLERGTKLDFAYIDEWHTFDYTLLDFFYIDKMLRTGGVVAFNDCGWLAVDRVLRFVQSHRKYADMDAGLEPPLLARWKNPALSPGEDLSHTPTGISKRRKFGSRDGIFTRLSSPCSGHIVLAVSDDWCIPLDW
jgi:hypothetical protein